MNNDELLAAEQRLARKGISDFCNGAASGDLDRMARSFSLLDSTYGGWRKAFKKVSRIGGIPKATKEFFLQVFLRDGDHLRQETGDDLIYLSGLRVLLPSYEGQAVQLYRGEGARNRKRRTYGPSWTITRMVALEFARTGPYRCSDGGSVLLSVIAPPESIIAAPSMIDDSYNEQEYIVDRRFLYGVRVEERFHQLTYDERQKLIASRV